MNTLRLFSQGLSSIPTATASYLTDIAESKGKQELFARQAPQRLKALRENALIESAVSSNRIEGVEIDRARIATVMFGTPVLKDRDEEEVQGYRRALSWIHTDYRKIDVSESTIRKLHELSRGEVWDTGTYKAKDGDIIETYANGRSRVRFQTVPAADTPASMSNLIRMYGDLVDHADVAPFILGAAFNLDFLCIHPFRDGNGRVSRLLLLLQAYHSSLDAGRYISLERLIEQNKQRYYETLEQSSIGWHDGRHDPWPYINFLLFIFKSAFREMEDRAAEITTSRGEKTAMIVRAIDRRTGEFSVAAIQEACPVVSINMIRKVMKDLKAEGRIESVSRGRDARWRKTTRW